MSKKNFLVSVIIPTYNRCKLVTKAIDSVLAQTYGDYEIIVVDDGSTDDTKKVLSRYDGKIRYIYQENKGVASARNTGIREAKGKWIAFLDSDDVWLPDKLASQIESIKRNNIKVCFTNSKFSDINKPRVKPPGNSENKTLTEKIIDDPYNMFLITAVPQTLPTMLVDKGLLKEVGNFNEDFRIGEDTRLFFDLALKTPFVFLYDVLAIINRNESRKGLVNNNPDTIRKSSQIQTSILARAYFHERQKSDAAVKSIRYRLGYALYQKTQVACVDQRFCEARCFAKDALCFSGDIKIKLRSLFLCCFPKLAGRILRRKWKERI